MDFDYIYSNVLSTPNEKDVLQLTITCVITNDSNGSGR